MGKLTISKETFNEMLLGFIKAGVVWTAKEIENGMIEVTFTGGY